MLFLYNNNYFATNNATKKIIVAINTKFIPRKYINKDGKSPLYLYLTSLGIKKQLNLDLHIDLKKWDFKKQRLIPKSKEDEDINLLLDNINSKITNIKTLFRLSNRTLTLDLLIEEIKESTPRVDFIKFMQAKLNENKPFYKKGTIIKQQSVIDKLKRFKPTIYFPEINDKLLKSYKRFCLKEDNKLNTINSNIAVIKKYINIAIKLGISIPLNVDELKVARINSSRIDLHYTEVNKLKKYLQSEFITDERKHILGLFLFSCFTGLRISDLVSLSKSDIIDDTLTFVAEKTSKQQRIRLNASAKMVMDYINFDDMKTTQYLNREIKIITNICNIKKKVSFHVARHSFATNYLRAGGKVEKLQLLLGHSKIKETMIYVHIVEQEMEEDIMLMDLL